MPRPSTKIKVITGRDKRLMKQLANTGLCSTEQAKTYCGVSRDRLSKLEKSGYIRLDKTSPYRGKYVEVVRLNTKGRAYCKTELGQKYFYNSNMFQSNHDLKLAEAYYQVTTEHPNAVWKNETEVMKNYKEVLFQRNCVDALVITSSGTFAIEVVGYKYTKEKIDSKVANGNLIADKTILI